MSEQKFFRCKHCGNLINSITNSGIPILCCGDPMEELCSNTVEAATEVPCDRGCEDTEAERYPGDETVCSAEFSEGCI